MGWSFRRSMKIAPGIRLNFSKNGTGVSFGPRGAKYSISPTGRHTISGGIPGSGISYREQINSTAKPRGKTRYATNYYDNQDRSYSKAHPFIGGFLVFIGFSTFYYGITTWPSDKQSAATSIVLALAIAFVGAFIYRSRKYPEQPGGPSEMDTIQNSRFVREPMDLTEWATTNEEFTQLVAMMEKAALNLSDNSMAPTFPVKKGEVVYAKFNGAITDFDGLERSEIGTIYLTDKRVSFIGLSETEEWAFENMSGPVAQALKRVMTFPLTTRKKVSGVTIIDDDWLKFLFFLEAAIKSQRFGDEATAYYKELLAEYQKKMPKGQP